MSSIRRRQTDIYSTNKLPENIVYCVLYSYGVLQSKYVLLIEIQRQRKISYNGLAMPIHSMLNGNCHLSQCKICKLIKFKMLM